MPDFDEKDSVKCSICGKSHDLVKRMVSSGGSACICNECIERCLGLIGDDTLKPENSKKKDLPKPVEIKKQLDEYCRMHTKRILVKSGKFCGLLNQ